LAITPWAGVALD